MASQSDLYYFYLMNQLGQSDAPAGSEQYPSPPTAAPRVPPQIVDIGRRIGDPNNLGMTPNYTPNPYVSPVDPFDWRQKESPQAKFTPPNLRQIGESAGSVTTKDRPSAYDEPLGMEWSQEYRDLYDQFPKREKPSVWNRIGGALTSLDPSFSPEEREYIKNPKYAREMMDWKAKQEALETPYIQERLERQGIRTARRYEDVAQNAAERNRITEEHYRRADAINLERTRNNAKIWEQEDGNMFLVYPDGRIVDTQTKVSDVPWDKKLGWEIEKKTAAEIEIARVRGEEARKTAAVPTTVNTNITTTTPATPLNPAQIEQDRVNRASELKRQYETMSSWIFIDPKTQEVQIAPMGTPSKPGGIPLTQELREIIRQHIDENKPLPPEITTRSSTTTRERGPISPVQQPVQPDPFQPSTRPGGPVQITPQNVRPAPPANMPPLGSTMPDGSIVVYDIQSQQYGTVSAQEAAANPTRFLTK